MLPAGVDQAQLLAKPAIGGVVAGVAHSEVHLHGLPQAPIGRRGQAFNHQVGARLGLHRSRGGTGGHVVAGAAQLVDGGVGVGAHDEIARTRRVPGDGRVQHGGVTLAHAQRAGVRDGAQQHRAAGDRGRGR